MVNTSCTCPEVLVGGQPTGTRNWDIDCVLHGAASDWYNSDEQFEKRRLQNERSRAMQAEARRVRRGGRPKPLCRNCLYRHFWWEDNACDTYEPGTSARTA